MSSYRRTPYNRKAYVAAKIRAWSFHKQQAEGVPENRNIFRPRPSADAVVKIKLKGQPQIQFGTYRTPFGWSISPTLAGRKVQQVLLHA